MRNSTIIPKKKHFSKREKEIYNEGVRDALKSVRSFDGIISDMRERNYMVELIQKELSYIGYKSIKPEKQ